MPDIPTPVLRHLGLLDYETAWRRMQQFTDQRSAHSADELWFLEHPPVFTLGMAGRREHLLAPGAIPVLHTDRGGQVTYHGPGQLLVYALVDLRRAGLGVRDLVTALEQSVVRYTAGLGVPAAARREAPGVYVQGEARQCRHPHPAGRELSRAGTECKHGPGAFRAHQSVWICGTADDPACGPCAGAHRGRCRHRLRTMAAERSWI